MMARHRLFQLMARREVARAARAGSGIAAALGRARTAGAAAARHAALIADLERAGPVTAAGLVSQKRLATDLAAEAARQREIEATAEADAWRLRHLLAQHDLRRRLYSDTASRMRIAARAEAEDAVLEAMPSPRGRSPGVASDLQVSGVDPESAA